MSLTAYERETIINLNDAEGTAHVYTAMPTWKNRLAKLAAANPEIRLVRSDDTGAEYEFPKTWARVRPPIKRELTDEQRAALSERAKALRASQLVRAGNTPAEGI